MNDTPSTNVNRRILIIDDNQDIHADFRKVFDTTQAQESKIDRLEAELFGGGAQTGEALLQVEVDSAFHGQQGIEMALAAARQGKPYYMAFVDVRMPPGIDGIQTIKAIWKELPELQCVICTAYSDYDWAAIRRELGTSSNLLILKKPFDAVEVLQLSQALAEKVDLAGAAKSYLGKLEDQVQQLEQARLAAVEASRAKGEFLANMSHELRTPLNGVIGMGQLLMDTPLTPQQQRYVDAARLSAKVLLQLINDVLDFSKIEAGRLELEAIDFDPSTVIERVISLITDQARQKKGLDVLTFVDPQLPATLRGDPSRWQQILINLLANAVKFTAAGNVSLDVAVEQVREGELTVRCLVRDTGIGIPQERLPLLFQCFSQVDSSTTRKYGGTGLGLSICKKLVEMMGGEIGVESEPGKGATFWFTTRFGYSASPAGRYAQTVAAWDGLRVLLVGDSPTIVSSIQRQIGAWQIACELVGDGAVAGARLREAQAANQRYQIAIVDGTLPEVRLDEVTRVAAESQETAVLVIVPPGDERADQSPKQPGIAGYLCKPITASRLFNAMMSALQPPSEEAASESASRAPRTRRGAREPVVMKDTRILLVEDNEINQQVASELLRAAGYKCDIRANGREAVDTIAQGEYDIVLMDCQMPEMDGYEATRAVRQMEQSRGGGRPPLPIIALTANAMAGDRQRCLDAGMTDYVKKPLNRHELVATLERHIPVRNAECGVGSAKSGVPNAELKKSAPVGAASQAASPQSPGARHEPATAAPPLDCQSLVERFLGDWDFVQGILEKFQHQVDGDLEQLERSIVERNIQQATMMAHRIKGAAANVSATEISRLASELEQMGRRSNLEGADQRLAALRNETQRLQKFVQEELPAWSTESA